jgi:hypothetical protein
MLRSRLPRASFAVRPSAADRRIRRSPGLTFPRRRCHRRRRVHAPPGRSLADGPLDTVTPRRGSRACGFASGCPIACGAWGAHQRGRRLLRADPLFLRSEGERGDHRHRRATTSPCPKHRLLSPWLSAQGLAEASALHSPWVAEHRSSPCSSSARDVREHTRSDVGHDQRAGERGGNRSRSRRVDLPRNRGRASAAATLVGGPDGSRTPEAARR